MEKERWKLGERREHNRSVLPTDRMDKSHTPHTRSLPPPPPEVVCTGAHGGEMRKREDSEEWRRGAKPSAEKKRQRNRPARERLPRPVSVSLPLPLPTPTHCPPTSLSLSTLLAAASAASQPSAVVVGWLPSPLPTTTIFSLISPRRSIHPPIASPLPH